MCYIVNLSPLASLPSCPHLITIFAVRGTTVTFYRCEPLVRSRGICAALGVLLFALPHAYSREKRGLARDPIQRRGVCTRRARSRLQMYLADEPLANEIFPRLRIWYLNKCAFMRAIPTSRLPYLRLAIEVDVEKRFSSREFPQRNFRRARIKLRYR